MARRLSPLALLALVTAACTGSPLPTSPTTSTSPTAIITGAQPSAEPVDGTFQVNGHVYDACTGGPIAAPPNTNQDPHPITITFTGGPDGPVTVSTPNDDFIVFLKPGAWHLVSTTRVGYNDNGATELNFTVSGPTSVSYAQRRLCGQPPEPPPNPPPPPPPATCAEQNPPAFAHVAWEQFEPGKPAIASVDVRNGDWTVSIYARFSQDAQHGYIFKNMTTLRAACEDGWKTVKVDYALFAGHQADMWYIVVDGPNTHWISEPRWKLF